MKTASKRKPKKGFLFLKKVLNKHFIKTNQILKAYFEKGRIFWALSF
jgi:hypothetical protein